jgi:hypothetical protein
MNWEDERKHHEYYKYPSIQRKCHQLIWKWKSNFGESDSLIKLTKDMKIFIFVQISINPDISGEILSILIFRAFSINIEKITLNNFRTSISWKMIMMLVSMKASTLTNYCGIFPCSPKRYILDHRGLLNPNHFSFSRKHTKSIPFLLYHLLSLNTLIRYFPLRKRVIKLEIWRDETRWFAFKF